MFWHKNNAFACLKDTAWAALKRRPRLAAPTIKKIGSGSTLIVAAPAPQHCLKSKNV